MKTRLWLLASVMAVILSSTAAWGDGDCYVVVGGGRGIGTKITSLPFTINKPGFYYLTDNLSPSTPGNGITINCDHVTIDLMGFCLNGPTNNWTDTGIVMNGRQNVEIRNGTMTYWGIGIKETSDSGIRHRVFNIRAQCFSEGITLQGLGHIVKGCTITDTIKGITMGVGIISGCTLSNCQDWGITGGDTVSGNCTNNCGVGISIAGGRLIGNTVATTASGQTGIQLPGELGLSRILIDQNCSYGWGHPYTGGNVNVVWGKNAGLP